MEEILKSMSEAIENIGESLTKLGPEGQTKAMHCGYCGSIAHAAQNCPLQKYDEIKCNYCGVCRHIQHYNVRKERLMSTPGDALANL